MTATYEPIATTTLGTAAANITFSSIPQTYTDLVIVFFGGSARGSVDGFKYRLNADSASNYSTTRIYADGSSAYSDRQTNQTSGEIGNLSTNLSTNAIININNYSNSSTYKTVLSRNNLPESYVFVEISLWRSTSAITDVSIFGANANLLSGCTATLYGIKAE